MTGYPNDYAKKVTIRENVDLSAYNTLGISVKAKNFLEIFQPVQLNNLYKKGFFDKQKTFVLGGGSNVLLKDHLNYPVLKISIPGIEVVQQNSNSVEVSVGAGVVWHDVVEWAVDHDYGGIENLALIPGTMGAAPIQNIGAYGVELEQVFKDLDYFDISSGNFRTLIREECEFGYRDSIFKHKLKGQAVITRVTIKLKKSGNYSVNTSYASLSEYLSDRDIDSPGIRDVFDAVVSIRQSKLPDPGLLANAGSFFKNPVVDEQTLLRIKKLNPGMPFYNLSDTKYKIPAGWLIEQTGWKGKRSGNVGTYKNQALVIVNHGGATGEEVYQHALKIIESVKEKFGIELVPEVNIVE